MKWVKDHLIISLISGLLIVGCIIVITIFVVTNNKDEAKDKNFTIKNNGYYVYKGSDVWYQITFKEDNSFLLEPWYCPKSACGGGGDLRGTYKVKGNTIFVNIPEHYTDGDPMIDNIELMPEENWKITIVDDKQIVLKEKEFIWQHEDMFNEYEEIN